MLTQSPPRRQAVKSALISMLTQSPPDGAEPRAWEPETSPTNGPQGRVDRKCGQEMYHREGIDHSHVATPKTVCTVCAPETACAHRLCVRPRLRVLTRRHARDCVCSHVATPETRACDLHYVSIVSASAVSAAPYVSLSFLRSCLRQTIMLIQSSPDGAESREPETSLTRCHARDSGVATPEYWAQVQPSTDLFLRLKAPRFDLHRRADSITRHPAPSASHTRTTTHECSLPPSLYSIEQPGGRPLSPSELWPVSFPVASALTFLHSCVRPRLRVLTRCHARALGTSSAKHRRANQRTMGLGELG
jgi:hypothetical protein